ncbi:response regulator transcription factor [Rhizomicrobium electricum]|jgi:two-component system response regulator FixJ|uniref:Response regulator FixJ n=1 Tax=Rhizomicrobium electricum TaxID=480070 RepID=A0ABN1F173_9PROT|nr:response regulator [Rhizomicrobium electricum]NIJ50243.1 two-component system response regulator FixJ [Rhizomicrobium electricum]
MNTNPAICIVDDDGDIRTSLRVLLEAADFTVRDYASAVEFLDADVFTAACVIADLCMPEMDGLMLQREVARRRGDLPVVFVSGHGEVELAVKAMKAGAVDFLEKPVDVETLLASIRRAIGIGEDIRARSAEVRTARRLLALLTPREQHVLDELVAGQSNKTTAQKLGISPRTVEVYRAQIMNKLNAHSLSDMVRIALAARRPSAGN